jgi:phosphatidylserine decarboxylase
LCHFYWLIDQDIKGKIIENDKWFSEWLVDYADLWGTFLDTTESFNNEALESFMNDSPKYQVENSMVNGKPNNPSGWLTFNQFFARELNPGLRPITQPFNNLAITAPADCTYRAQYHIHADSSISSRETGDSTITLKKTHTFGNIKDLLAGSDYKEAFANGKFVHYFLGPYSYHRFHTPVSGTVKECYSIPGKVYLDVALKDGQFDAPDNSTDGADGIGYEFTQARGVITIDTTDSPYGDVGIIAIIPIGMCQVSSVHMTATEGSEALKGDEFGYFLFGGSDIIVLFQEHVAAQIDSNPDLYRHYGTLIARLQ